MPMEHPINMEDEKLPTAREDAADFCTAHGFERVDLSTEILVLEGFNSLKHGLFVTIASHGCRTRLWRLQSDTL